MPELPLVNRIHESSNQNVRFRALIAQFGDGYSQRSPDGLNSKVSRFDVSWSGLTVAEKDIVLSVLDSVGTWGVLTYTPPAESAVKKFVIEEGTGYSIDYVGLRFNISCSLEQVFDL